MDHDLIERAKRPDLRVGHGILTDLVAALPGRYALVSQPEPLRHVDPQVAQAASVSIEASSLEASHLEALAARLPDVDRVVGIGGGMTMDCAKFLAWRTGTDLTLAPSIVSVDAFVTNTVAVRREGSVVYEGFVVADPIIVDLDLIGTAPRRLNRAGVGDLLSIQTGRFDWALGARAGTIEFDPRIDAAAADVLERLYALADEVATVTDRALESIIRMDAEVNALLLSVGHSGPEEGSEHYLGYAIEAATGRSFVHGELIGLGIVLMAGLQDNAPERAAAFLDRCGVEWRPAQLGLDSTMLEQVMIGLPAFVRSKKLPHSIIDEAGLDQATVAQLVASLPAPVGIPS